MPVIDVPDALRGRLGAEGTKALVDLFNQAARETRDDVISLVEERFARRLAEVESRLVRWSFVFWATLMVALFLRT